MLAKTLGDVLYRAQAKMESERMALIDPKVPLIDTRLLGNTQSDGTEGRNHRHSLSESLGGDS
jgi:hypothetical protein